MILLVFHHCGDPPRTRPGHEDLSFILRQKKRTTRYFAKWQCSTPATLCQEVTQFVIDKDGKVQNVKASGMGNKAVEQCIATAIKSIEFPKPESGGKSKVRYPFTFTPEK